MVAALLLMAAACTRSIAPVTTPVTNNEIKTGSGQVILAGHASVSVLQQPDYKTWYDKSYNVYTVDTTTVKQLQPIFKNQTMDIFLGSWCGDSKREVPRMFKILESAGIDTTRVHLVFVDNRIATYKQSPQHEEQGRNIHHVPTFIIYDAGKEIGRIVESPVLSLEKDLLHILSRQSYTPNYQAINYWFANIKNRKKRMSDAQLQAIVVTIHPLCKHYGELNTCGYVLMAAKKQTEALNIFRLNAMIYPETPGVFDSLGEALAATGNKAQAIKAYERVLALRPDDANAKEKLRLLRQ